MEEITLSVPGPAGGLLAFQIIDDEPTLALWVEVYQTAFGKRRRFEGVRFDPDLNQWAVPLPAEYTAPREFQAYRVRVYIQTPRTPTDALREWPIMFNVNNNYAMFNQPNVTWGIAITVNRPLLGGAAIAVLPVALIGKSSFSAALTALVDKDVPTLIHVARDERMNDEGSLYQKVGGVINQILLGEFAALPVANEPPGDASRVKPGPIAEAPTYNDMLAYAPDNFGLVGVVNDGYQKKVNQTLYLVNRGSVKQVMLGEFDLIPDGDLPLAPNVTDSWPPVAGSFNDMLAYALPFGVNRTIVAVRTDGIFSMKRSLYYITADSKRLMTQSSLN